MWHLNCLCVLARLNGNWEYTPLCMGNKKGFPCVWITNWFITSDFFSFHYGEAKMRGRWSRTRNEIINEIGFLFFFHSIFHQPLPPLPPIAQQPSMSGVQKSNNELVSTTTQTTCLSTIKPATSVASTTTPTGIVKPTPSIAVTHTQSIEREEKALMSLSQRSKPTSPNKRKDIKKHMQHKSKHSALDRIHRWVSGRRKRSSTNTFALFEGENQ